MASTFGGLNIAGSGLRAANASLNTTANNISNAETEGYSRQNVVQTAAHALRTYTSYGCTGSGVDTLGVERQRDDFYDAKYWNNMKKYGEYSIKQYYCTQIEDYFKDDGKSGFATLFDAIERNLQEVIKNPNSDSTKRTFLSSAQSLAKYFNNMAGNLNELQKDLNAELKLSVDQINSIAAEIATLNKQINVVELSTGTTANELRDKRTLLIDELSELVEVNVIETPVYDTNNPDRETGGTRCLVTIAGGQTLIDGNDYKTLFCQARESTEKVNQDDAEGLYDVYWADGSVFSLANSQLGGKLKGIYEMRDGNNGENFYGKVAGVNVDSAGTCTMTVATSADYLQDITKTTLPSNGGKIVIGNTEYHFSSWDYEKDADGNLTGNYIFTMTEIIPESRVTSDVKIGNSVDCQGIPYYMAQMNEFVRNFAGLVNDILTAGFTSNGQPGSLMFTANIMTDDGQYELSELEADDYYFMTAKNFAVDTDMLLSPSLLATKGTASNGVEENDTVKALLAMFSDKETLSFRGGAANEFLECILADMALSANSANTFAATYESLKLTINNQRTSVSGVDTDEEAVNLVKFQNGYNLSSKVIQTMTEMLDRLITQTGV